MKSPSMSRGILLLACATALASSLTAGFPAALEQAPARHNRLRPVGRSPASPARREVEAAAAVSFLKPSRTT